ncbi:MAG: PAS domain-containing protein [Nitrospirae bacterium]|nr:PAS domain-containing protein [Nitrospirota bacterium]
MKSNILIISGLIVVISVLIILNIFFQKSLQMEIAEQFNLQQSLLSKTIADNIKASINFMKEEVTEMAHELSEKKNATKDDYDSLIKEEFKHKLMISASIGIASSKGAILFLKGDEDQIKPIMPDIAKKAVDTKEGDGGILVTGNRVVALAPTYKNNQLDQVVFLSFSIADIGDRFFTTIKSHGKGYAWMIDKGGNLLYHPTQPGMVGRNLYRADTTCFKCHMNFDLEKRIIEGRAGDNIGRYISAFGEDKIIAYSDVDMSDISWIIAVSSPYSEVTSATKNSMKLYSYLIISIFMATSLVSAVLIIFNKKRIQAAETANRKEQLEKYAGELEKKVTIRTAELASEKEKLNTIVSAIGGGIVLLDKGRKIQWSNTMIRDIVGMEVVGRSWEEVCPDCPLSETYPGETIRTIVLSNLFGQKGRFYQITTAPVRGERGEIDGHIGLIQDVTEMKKMEDQIIHSEKLASIGRLAAGIAHEIGNPLTSIFSFVQILREMEEEAFKKESLDTMYFHIKRISDILKQLSGFSKMPAGEHKSGHVNEFIEASLNLIQYDKKAKDVTVVKELSTDLPEVIMDGNQLAQVIVNLTLNAIDAMPDGGTITIRSFTKNSDVIIQIQDTGIGISKEDVTKIFDPFYTTKEKGTGLGLAVSYDIIKKMNGTLSVESETGKGTVFTITMPYKDPAATS